MVTFQAAYYNPHPYNSDATMMFMVDNIADMYLNGVLLVSVPDLSWVLFQQYPMVPVSLLSGVNSFVFKVTNQRNTSDVLGKNPAGLLYSLIDSNGAVLLHSGCVTGEPKGLGIDYHFLLFL